MGPTNSKGYGLCSGLLDPQAHRAAYKALVGPIPDGLTVDHLCGFNSCVNPEHLELVTRVENSRRQGGGTDDYFGCGHPRTKENTAARIRKNGNVKTFCRLCRNERERRRVK